MENMPDLFYKLIPELAEFGTHKELSGNLSFDSLRKGAQDFYLDHGIDFQVELSNTGEGVLLQGSAKTSGITECARCLEEASFAIEGDVEGYFILEPEPGDAKGSNDEFTVVASDGIIDLTVPIIAALIYELPQIALCKEDCAGLCSSCGQNLNEKSCGCDNAPDSENPFAILKTFDITKTDGQ